MNTYLTKHVHISSFTKLRFSIQTSKGDDDDFVARGRIPNVSQVKPMTRWLLKKDCDWPNFQVKYKT